MATKVKKFKAKTHKGTKKRLVLTNPADSSKAKIIIGRINHAHRLINKTGERKLKAGKTTTISKAHDKYKKLLG